MYQPPKRRSLDEMYREQMGLAQEDPPIAGVRADTARKKSLSELYEESGAQAEEQEPEREAERVNPLVGMAREFATRATMGAYPRVVGAVSRYVEGKDPAEEEARIRGAMEAFSEQSGGLAKGASIAGTVAPYFGGIGGLARSAAQRAGLGGAMQTAERGYQAARNAPAAGAVLRKVLPTSAGTAAELATVEGIRGAAEAEPDESRIGAALKQAATAMPFGRAGEVVGTALAGRIGPTLGRLSAKAQQTASDIGAAIGQWKQGQPVPLTPKMAQLYQKSELLRNAVDDVSSELGLPANNATVIANAYSRVVERFRGTKDMADVQKQVLQPFLREVDNAAQGPLSPLIQQYANAKRAEEAVTTGRQTVQYLRQGTGSPGRVSPEVVAQRAAKPYTSQAEKDALAQSLVASLGRSGTVRLGGGLAQTIRNIALPFRGAGDVSNLLPQIGGSLTGAQQATVQGARGVGASSLRNTRSAMLDRLFGYDEE
jgi:hypothetical protein